MELYIIEGVRDLLHVPSYTYTYSSIERGLTFHRDKNTVISTATRIVVSEWNFARVKSLQSEKCTWLKLFYAFATDL